MDARQRVGGMTPPRHGEGDRAAQRRGGGGVPVAHRPVVVRARALRGSMTLPEILLWQRLRGGQTGSRFRRQHPIGPYIADFYCSRLRLVIEVDGETHGRGTVPEYDRRRDGFLEENGYRIMRIAAVDVLRNIDGVMAAIAASVAPPLHHQPAAGGPPPRAGEERP